MYTRNHINVAGTRARMANHRASSRADVVLVMEKSHRNKISKRYKEQLMGKRLVCLDIPDIYARMDPDLVKLLEARVKRYVRF